MNKKVSINKIIDNPKFIKIAIIVGISAIALIFISGFLDFSDLKSKQNNEEYCKTLEQKLLSVITQIEGVGEAKIFLTMDNNGEDVYVDNSDRQTKSITPVVRGVVVVCDGGDNPVVINRVMSAVTKSLNISTNKVCVTKLSK